MLADFGRLVLLILLLPLILILIGPLLILAAIRGHQPLGPITLDTARYKPAARTGAFILGLLLWLLVWGGLTWFAIYAFSLPATSVTLVSEAGAPEGITPTVLLPTVTSTSTSLPPPTNSPTPQPASSTPSGPSPTTLPLPPDSTSTSTSTPSPKITASATPSPTLDQTAIAETASPTVSFNATLTSADRQAAITVVEEGNVLLREAIAQASEENLQKMETVWRGLALQVAKNFATTLYKQYAKPLEVKFEYINPPVVDPQSTSNEVVVTSREKWNYGGPTKIDHEEAFEFIYTLSQEDGQWVITRYTYRNLTTSTSTPTLNLDE